MSKFNPASTVARNETVNYAGGPALQQSSKLEFVSILLTSFLKDQFYRTEAETVVKLRQLLDVTDAKFAAKAAVFARREFGMRSVTHFIAAELGNRVKAQTWTRRFFQRIVRRPDDLLEILACHQALTNKGPIPNAMKRGFGAALHEMSASALAKYRKSNAGFTMVDAVNLCRPKSSEALAALMKGTLAPAETWETKLTQAGQAAQAEGMTEEQKDEAFTKEWAGLVLNKKLGYMALVRNLRNILTHAPEVIDEVCIQLQDAEAIKRSLMFPFRFLTAIDVVGGMGVIGAQKVLRALNRAVDLSLANVPKFNGRTLVALDESGSMTTTGNPPAYKIGTLFAATLVKANPDHADLLTFSTDARYRTVNPDDSTLTIAASITFNAGGTDFHSIFSKANKQYDRVIILSDMQGWIGGNRPTSAFLNYCARHMGSKNDGGIIVPLRPRIYSFDLAGYGSMQFPEPEVYCLAGFSDKVFDIMALFETDKQALITRIEEVDLERAAVLKD